MAPSGSTVMEKAIRTPFAMIWEVAKGFNNPFDVLKELAKKQAAEKKPALAKKALGSTPPAPAPAKQLSDEELFLREVGGTAPVEAKGGRVGHPKTERRPARPAGEDAEVLAQLADLIDGTGTFDIADTDEFIEGIAENVDRRLLRQLRAGEYAVQAHLDLHGLTRDEAKEKVARFLAESRKASRRCVLLVHGRGLHSKDSVPVLKQSLRGWLERGQISRAVLAFATARPHDGGAGALYVLLRK
jgi:DNA-nicking Smr family endonuclease